MDEPKVCYMDMVDWQHELGYASDGNKVFPSVNDAKKYSPCWKQCGIVKVEIRLIEVVEPQNLNGNE